MRRTLPLLSSILLLLLLFLGLNERPRALSASRPPGLGNPARTMAAGAELLASGEDGLEFVLNVPGYEVDATGTVLVPGLASATRQEGAPALPAYSTLVLLPPEAKVHLEVEVLDRKVEAGLHVRPAPQTSRSSLRLPEVTDRLTTLGEPAFVGDPAIYGQDALYPSYDYRISEPMYYRDLRLVRLELFPLRYNPRTMRMAHAGRMRVSISFEGAQWQKSGQAETTAPGTYDPIASQVINHAQGQDWRALPAALEGSATKLPVGKPTFKIAVDEDSIYEIGYDALQDAGMDVGSVDPNTFEMLYRGEPVAYELVGDDDDQFEPGEAVRFYAWAFDGSRLEHQFLTENVYWLWAGGTPTSVGTIASTVNHPAADSFRESITREPERVYMYSWTASWPAFPNEPDTWFWAEDVVTSSGSLTATRQITLPTPYAGGSDAQVTVELLSRNSGPNHDVSISLNDAQAFAGNFTWENVQDVNVTTTVPMTAVLEGLNEVQVRYDTVVASGKVYYYLNRITVDYPRRFIAENDRLIFADSGPPKTYHVAGFGDPNPVVWEITDRLQPRVVTGVDVSGGGPYAYTFGTGFNDGAYVAVPESGVLDPLSIEKYVPPSLEAPGGADWIAISHANFMNAAQELALHRSNPAFGNLSTHVVDIADVIKQYGYGLPLPAAISDYLAHALADWPVGPRYVLLVGDGHVNPRQIPCLSGGSYCPSWDLTEPNYVLTDLVYWDQVIGINNSDYSFSLLSGDDLIPDIAVGRLAVQTNEEALNIVDKIVDYETSRLIPQEWHRDVVFVADNPDLGGDFCTASQAVGDTLPATFNPLYLCLPEDPTETDVEQLRADMRTAVNYPNGATILNYRGHGAPRHWAGNLVNLDLEDAGELAPPWLNNEPLVILSLDCYDGFFAIPGDAEHQALSERYLRMEAIGTVAHWSSTGLGWDFQHKVLHQGFYDGLFGQGLTAIGDAVNYAKLDYLLSNYHRSQLYSFVLQGDPAMQLTRPGSQAIFLPALHKQQ